MAAGWAVAGGRWTGCWAEETASLGLRPERRSAWRVTECLRWLARTCWLRATHLGFVSAAPRATGSVLGWTSQLAAASGMLSTRGGRGRVRRRGGGWCSERCPERWQQLSQRKRPRRLSERRPMTSPWSNRPPRPPLSRTGPLAHYPLPSSLYDPGSHRMRNPFVCNGGPLFSIFEFWLRARAMDRGESRNEWTIETGATVLDPGIPDWKLYSGASFAPNIWSGVRERSRLLVLAVEFCEVQRAECRVQLAAGCEMTTRQLVAAATR